MRQTTRFPPPAGSGTSQATEPTDRGKRFVANRGVRSLGTSSHLAMNYWPDRVREKCKTDKSLAIAHGLEHLYTELEAQPKKARGRKKSGGDE